MKSKTPKLTRRYLLTHVKKLILREPKRLRMDIVLESRCGGKNAPSCGTVGCIAGWTCVVAQRHQDSSNLKQSIKQVMCDWSASTTEAAKWLRLGERQRIRLCFDDAWPRKLKKEYALANTPQERARVTCKRIDLFLKSGGKK